MASISLQRLFAVRSSLAVLAGVWLSAVAHGAWAPVPALTNSPPKSQFAAHELYFSDSSYEMPYYLKHFAQVANAVVETGFNRVETNGTSPTTVTNFYPPGFLDIRVNRDTRDNRPYNARIMEMQMALAYFYTAERPWNVYRGNAAVRVRLEEMLKRWVLMQNADGLFAEYWATNFSLAPTGFGVMAAAQALDLIKNSGQPFDAAVLEDARLALRKALNALFTRTDMQNAASSYSNQYSGAYHAALLYLENWPDADLDAKFVTAFHAASATDQSPTGYFYEADGPEFGYSNVHERNMRIALTRLRNRTNDLLPVAVSDENKWASWLGANLVLQPNISTPTFLANAGINTRTTTAFQTPESRPLSEFAPLSRAFSYTDSEFTNTVKAKTDGLPSTPTYGSLTLNSSYSYIPTFVFEGLQRTETWHPTAAERTAAINSLPYFASARFNRILHNGTSNKELTVATVRRPSYYGLFNSGRSKANQMKFGLGLLWNPSYGTALQAVAGGFTNSISTSWGTSRTNMTRVYEHLAGGTTLGAVLRREGGTFGLTNGANNLADGVVSATYNLVDGSTTNGSKAVTFDESRIKVDVTHANAFTERLPLIAPSNATRTTNATQLVLANANGSRLIMRLLSGGSFTVAGAATDNLPSALRRHAVTISATNSLSYELFVTSDAFIAGTLGAPTSESYSPANGGADAGETVTYNLPLVNLLGASTSSNFTATLQASGGVLPVTTNQVYGAVAAGATVSKPFSFSVNGNFGDPLTITLALRDGATDYGTVSYQTFIGGVASGTTTNNWQNFDGVTAPALPSGWVSSVSSGTANGWTTGTNAANTAPNAVFALPTGAVSEQVLDSPAFILPSAAADPEIRFQHRWNTENTYDGGLLEISVDGGAYTDILAAGGSFLSGAYSGTLSAGHQNPLGGRPAWFGSADSAYTQTRIALPSSMLGKSVRLRFRLGSDSSISPAGAVWRIDTLQFVYRALNYIQPAEISSAAPAGAVPVGSAYSHTFTAIGQPAPSFAVTAGTLPAGMTLSPSGVLSGTVSSNFSARSITVAATNGVTPVRANASQTFTLQPLVALAISTTSLEAATVGTAYSASLAVTGGISPYTWTVASGALPAGLSLSEAGVISGTPLSSGTANFSVRVTDGSGTSITESLSMVAANPAALSVVTPSLPDGLAGTAYSATLSAVSGTGPFTWSLASGALPAGLSFSSGGILTGTPTASGSSTFTVRVTDSAAATATRTFTLSVSGTLAISTASLPDARTGTVYSATLGVTGGTGPFTWSSASGVLPPGLTLESAGVISGTAAGLGSFSFVARVTDASNEVAEREFTINAVNTLTWDAQPATAGIQTGNGTWTTATNTTNWSLSNSNVAWVNGSDAVIGGGTITATTPLTVGSMTFNANVVVNGSSPITVREDSIIAVNGADSTIAAPLAGTSFTKDGTNRLILSNAGYAGDLNISAGELRLNEPAGERTWNGKISGNGALLVLGSGRIMLGGASTFTGQATLTGQSVIRLTHGSALGATNGNTRLNGDSNNAPSVELTGGITVAEPFQLIMWTPGVINTNTDHAQIRNIGGTNELTGQIGLDAGGGRWDIASDEGYLKVSAPVVNIAQRTSANADTWRTLHLRGAAAGEFTGPMTDATNGFSKLNVTVLSGTWTLGGSNKSYTGATIISNGTLAVSTAISSEVRLFGGTLAGQGSTTAGLVVSNSATILRAVTDWNAPGPGFTAAQLRGTNSPALVVRVDGAGLTNFSETARTIPVVAVANGIAGLSPGTITTETSNFPGHGTWSVATNSAGLVAIYDPDELTISAQNLPGATQNAVYNFQFTATGGVQSREWALASGALPEGLMLTSGGFLSGTPSVSGSFEFNVQVTDSAGISATRVFALVVDAPPLEVLTTSLQDAAVGEYHSESLRVGGGFGPYEWSLAGGALPAGLVLAADGELVGVPAASGNFVFTAKVTDGRGSIAQRSLQIAVSAMPGSFDEWSNGVRWPDDASSALMADPDGDGVVNLFEHAFDTDPLSSGAPPVVSEYVEVDGRPAMRLRFRRSGTALGLRFAVRAASNLAAATWQLLAEAEPGGPMTSSDPGVLVGEEPLPDGAYEVTVTEEIPAETGSRFMKLHVTEEMP
jgi:autotransporter-associated beta strand protein